MLRSPASVPPGAAIINPVITGGSINNVVIGGSTPAAITGTTITASTAFRGTDFGSGAASGLSLTTTGGAQFAIGHVASAVNYLEARGDSSTFPILLAQGSGTNISAKISSKGTGSIYAQTAAGTLTQVEIIHTASANRYITLTGSNGSSPFLSTSAGNLDVGAAGSITGSITATGLWSSPVTAIPAGGTAALGVRMSSTSNFGLFFGSGAPTLSAAQGSIYLRSDGSSTSTRLYVNSDGGTTWVAITTAS